MKEKRNLKNYADYLFQKELSKGTISIYARQAGLLLQYLNGKPITKKTVLEYKKYLLSQNKKITTTNLYIVAVNSYLKYTGNENCAVKTERLQSIEIYFYARRQAAMKSTIILSGFWFLREYGSASLTF